MWPSMTGVALPLASAAWALVERVQKQRQTVSDEGNRFSMKMAAGFHFFATVLAAGTVNFSEIFSSFWLLRPL